MKYGNLSRLFVLLDSIGTNRKVLESDRKTLQINEVRKDFLFYRLILKKTLKHVASILVYKMPVLPYSRKYRFKSLSMVSAKLSELTLNIKRFRNT